MVRSAPARLAPLAVGVRAALATYSQEAASQAASTPLTRTLSCGSCSAVRRYWPCTGAMKRSAVAVARRRVGAATAGCGGASTPAPGGCTPPPVLKVGPWVTGCRRGQAGAATALGGAYSVTRSVREKMPRSVTTTVQLRLRPAEKTCASSRSLASTLTGWLWAPPSASAKTPESGAAATWPYWAVAVAPALSCVWSTASRVRSGS
mmetsp:Transcript_7309/g.22438  ORF Transcript_7309/g.22438 Transcript_7309/m.22438 type:complete len:206 (+) Transcript_7309:6106-6723(+)